MSLQGSFAFVVFLLPRSPAPFPVTLDEPNKTEQIQSASWSLLSASVRRREACKKRPGTMVVPNCFTGRVELRETAEALRQSNAGHPSQ